MPPAIDQYAAADNLRAYISQTLSEQNTELEAILRRAEREIDLYLPDPGSDATRLKIVLSELSVYTAGCLTRATCAQAEYRLHMGEPFFIQKDVPVSGPGIDSDRAQPRLSPKAVEELVDGGFLSMTGRFT